MSIGLQALDFIFPSDFFLILSFQSPTPETWVTELFDDTSFSNPCALIFHWWSSCAYWGRVKRALPSQLLVLYHFPYKVWSQEKWCLFIHVLQIGAKKEHLSPPLCPLPELAPMSQLQIQTPQQQLPSQHSSLSRIGSTSDNARRKTAEVSDQLRINQCRIPVRLFLQNRSALEQQAEEQESSSWHWSHLITY